MCVWRRVYRCDICAWCAFVWFNEIQTKMSMDFGVCVRRKFFPRSTNNHGAIFIAVKKPACL